MRKSRNVLMIALVAITAGSWLLAWSVPVAAQEGLRPAPAGAGNEAADAMQRQATGPITGIESIRSRLGAGPTWTESPAGSEPQVTAQAANPAASIIPAGVTTQPIINGGNKDLSAATTLQVSVEVGPVNKASTSVPGEGWKDSAVGGVTVWIAKAGQPPAPNMTAVQAETAAPPPLFDGSIWGPGVAWGAGAGQNSAYWFWTPWDGDPGSGFWPVQESDDVSVMIVGELNDYLGGTSGAISATPYHHIDSFDLAASGATPENPLLTVYEGTYDITGLESADYYIGIEPWGTLTLTNGTPDDETDDVANQPWRFDYDGISGFTTQAWQPTGEALIVDDYMHGQQWVSLARPERTGDGPIEEGPYEVINMPVESHWGHNFTGASWWDDGFSPVVGTPNDLIQGDVPFSFLPLSPYDRQAADWWRVACRGPIPDTILNRYLPEPNPYKSYDTALGDTSEQQYRGPFTATPGAPGTFPARTEVDLYPVTRGVFWSTPYTGNVFVGEGSITDPEAQATIQQFVEQGGAIFLSGQDVAWALSLNGAVQSSFLQTVFGATFVRDDVGNLGGKLNGLAHDDVDIQERPGSTRGTYPAQSSANPLSRPPNNGTSWWAYPAGSDQPAIDPYELRFVDMGDPNAGNWYTDAFLGVQSNGIVEFNQQWPDVIAASGSQVAYQYTTSGETAAVYMIHPQGSGPRGGMTAYTSFGLEGVSREFNQSSNAPTECLMKRNKIAQNFLSWGRTAVLEGTVTAGSGVPGYPAGTPLPNVLVTFEPLTGQDRPTYAMLTDSNGYFYVRGLPTDSWRVTAWAPGLAADHEAGEITWPEPTNKGLPAEGFSMSIAPNGSISGRVSNDSEPPQGLNGIRVIITAMDAEGNILVNPLTNEAIVMETTTVTGPGGEDGYYLIEDVPSGVSYQVVANPEPKATTVQINHQTDDTTYSVESENLVPIIPATETEDIDFFLMPQPGRVFGTVFEEGTDPALGIDGALVTVVGTDPAVETESGADGDYDFATADEQFTVPAGSREITASAPGYQPSTVTVQVNANQSIELDIPLKPIPPGTITGKVTQSDGTTGVEGIQVRALFGPSGSQTVAATVTTNADGDFTFADIEAGVTYTIMATDTELGRNLEPNAGFRVTVESDGTHRKSDTGETLLFKIVPLTTYSSGVHLVSAPYNYPGIDPKTIFGETAADFNMAWWNPALGEYALYPDGVSTIERGKGYFVEFTAPREISRSGEPSDPAVRNQPFDIPLSAAGDGWNLIGNPYDFETDWTKITVLYDGQSLTFADAVAQNLIAGSLFGYDAALKDYFIFTSMRPFQGYWVRALAEGITIQTSNEPVVATGGDAATRSETPMAKRGIEWSLQLVAQVGEYRDSDNYLGVAPEDKGLDMRYDLDEPPMARTFAGDDVTVYFPATGADGSARMLAADFRNTLGAGESWEVMVDTTVPNSDVTLSWPDLRSLPRSFSATLEDLATGETVAMRSASHYTFGSGDATTPRRLKVTLRSQSGADNPTPQVLGVDSLARGVTVSYRLASDVDLRISVLNQAGRIVRTLVQDEHRSAGVHSETWDGRDDGGRALPAGEYRIEFRAVSEDGAVGRATARALR